MHCATRVTAAEFIDHANRWHIPQCPKSALIDLSGNQFRDALLLMVAWKQGCRTTISPDASPPSDLPRLSWNALQRGARGPALQSILELRDRELIVCTSGTTGTPKALLHKLSSLITTAEASSVGWPSNCCVGVTLPLSRIAGLVQLIRALVQPQRTIAFAYDIVDLLACGVSHLAAVPAQLDLWSTRSASAIPGLRDQLDELLLGGGPLSTAQRARLLEEGWAFRMTFGMTETAATIALTDVGTTQPYKPLSHCHIKVIENGSLAVATPTLALGHVVLGGQIRPLADTSWLITSDIVTEHDQGFLWKHRSDRMICSGGIKISCDLLEQRLEQLGVLRAWVFPLESALWGQRPIAFVLGIEDAQTLQQQMRARWGTVESCDSIKLAPAAWSTRGKIPQQELQHTWQHSCLSV